MTTSATPPAVIRRPGAAKGQSGVQAISARGWEYEHGETDAQIAAIEGLIDQVRVESGASDENKGTCETTGGCLRGTHFSWNVDRDGNVVIGTTYTERGDGVVSYRGAQLPGFVWVSETWTISPAGKVKGA